MSVRQGVSNIIKEGKKKKWIEIIVSHEWHIYASIWEIEDATWLLGLSIFMYLNTTVSTGSLGICLRRLAQWKPLAGGL